MLRTIEGVVVGVGQLKTLNMNLGDNCLGKPKPPPGQPLPWAESALAVADGGQGQFSQSK